MNIICASDPPFIGHMAAMLLSLVENNQDQRLRIFILDDGNLSGENQIRDMLKDYSVDLSFRSVHEDFPQDLTLKRGHVTRTAYARLLMDRVLPHDVDKVIYVDCDLIIKGDLNALWSHDLGGRTVGAVPEASAYEHHAVLGLPAGAPYFNSGVLLVDLRRWRERGIGGRALDFARRHPERLQWWDQCALNLILHDDWTSLERKWNFQTNHIAWERDGFVHFTRVPAEIRNSVRIVHYSGLSKPWHYMNGHPMKQDYLKYRRRTPWPLQQFEDRTPRNVLRRFVHRRVPLAVRAYHGIESIMHRR